MGKGKGYMIDSIFFFVLISGVGGRLNLRVGDYVILVIVGCYREDFFLKSLIFKYL